MRKYDASVDQILNIEWQNIRELLGTLDREVMEAIIERLLTVKPGGHKVITAGCGTSGATALRIAHTLNVCEIPSFFLDPSMSIHGGAGALRSGLMGVVFGVGWTPCIGPVLGGILALATVSSTSGRGIALMLAYCLGLGLPLVLVALGAVRANGRLAWFTRHHAAVSLVSGGLLMLIGFLMITNIFARLAGVIPGIGI